MVLVSSLVSISVPPSRPALQTRAPRVDDHGREPANEPVGHRTARGDDLDNASTVDAYR